MCKSRTCKSRLFGAGGGGVTRNVITINLYGKTFWEFPDPKNKLLNYTKYEYSTFKQQGEPVYKCWSTNILQRRLTMAF